MLRWALVIAQFIAALAALVFAILSVLGKPTFWFGMDSLALYLVLTTIEEYKYKKKILK